MVMAKAVLTARGGMTSHAAVVARGMGKPLRRRRAGRCRWTSGRASWPSTAGSWPRATGSRWTAAAARCSPGQAALRTPELSGDFLRLMQWADRIRQLRVRVNADTPADAHRGRDFGAEGIGLCRTEHMFFDGDRLIAMREMIVAQDTAGRKRALAKLLPMQRVGLRGHLPRDGGLPGHHPAARPATARIPAQGARARSRRWRASSRSRWTRSRRVIDRLHEVNPMLGLRGCRLGIIYPEITAMQVRAIFEAACTVAARKGRVMPEVMIPLTASVVEFRKQALIVRAGGGGGVPRAADHRAVPARHHDRAAARRAHRRRAGARGAVLLVRHQRPHPDHLGPVAATTRATSCPTTSSTASSRTTRSRCWTRPASAS